MYSRFRFIAGIGVALGVGFLVGFSFRSGPPVVQAPVSGDVHLLIYFGDSPAGEVREWRDIPLVTGATAFSIMKQEVEKAQMPLMYDPSTGAGVFVRQIDDKKNGDSGRYWQYWINEKFALVAADQYLLSAGDTVEWKFLREYVSTDY